MRDSDQDLTSVVLVRASSSIDHVSRLRGCTVATGALDSPQSTLLPLAHLAGFGLEPGTDFIVRRFDVSVTKHGDHVGGEREAVEALIAGEADGACIIDGNLLAFAQEGTIETGVVRILTQTPPYDHCTMTVLDDVDQPMLDRLLELLLSMSFDDPAVRPLLQLEGLKQWRVGRTSGYRQLEAAVDRLAFYGTDGTILTEGYG
jgi:ABC-type phosphate/phosphonate transport system substrate-binding protein